MRDAGWNGDRTVGRELAGLDDRPIAAPVEERPGVHEGDPGHPVRHHPEVELPAVEVEPPENTRRGRGEVGLPEPCALPGDRFQVGEPAVSPDLAKAPALVGVTRDGAPPDAGDRGRRPAARRVGHAWFASPGQRLFGAAHRRVAPARSRARNGR